MNQNDSMWLLLASIGPGLCLVVFGVITDRYWHQLHQAYQVWRIKLRSLEWLKHQPKTIMAQSPYR